MLDAYGERLLEAVHKRKVRRLFIDGLNGFKKAAIDPGRMDHFFTALANELRVLGVTTLYTLEVPDILGQRSVYRSMTFEHRGEYDFAAIH